MPETATVLVAAFGGGLAGAVLQPVVNHLLQRRRFEEEIRKKLEQHLRHMIEAEITWVKYLGLVAEMALLSREAGNPVTLQQITQMLNSGLGLFRLDREIPRWEPERIADSQLRDASREYYKLVKELTLGLTFGSMDREKWAILGAQLKTLQQQITLRMDELDWPERAD